jgi:hypothetical protein
VRTDPGEEGLRSTALTWEEAFHRLRRGGLTGLVAGEEKTKTKALAGGIAGVLFLLAIPTVGVLIGLAGVVLYSVVWGLVIRFRKRRAGVPLDSADY